MRAIVGIGLVLALLATGCREPEDPLEEIRTLREQGRFALMVEPLRRLLDADASSAEAQLLLGEALLATGQAGLAVWPLRRASESPEHAVPAGLLLARAMLESRTAPDALVALERVLELEPENEDALGMRIEAYLATARYDEALAEMERVLERDPENLQVLVPTVTTLIRLERIEEAEIALDRAQERMNEAGEDAPPAMRGRLCIARAMFAFEKGEIELAEARYAECLEAFPRDRLVVGECVSFEDRQGRPERGTEILEQALAETDDAYFRIGLARRLGALGEPEGEERLLREQVEARPSARSWFALADFHVQRDEFDEALVAFEQALALTPSPSPMLRFAYADTLVQAGRFDDAHEMANELEQAELRSLIRGRILLAQGDAEAALGEFEAGLRLWPNNPAGRFLAGQAAERTGRFERAISEYRESLRSGAAATKAGLALAPLHAEQRDFDGALAAIQAYVQGHQTDPEGFVTGVRIAQAAKRPGVAREGLDRLAKLPGQAGRALALEVELVVEVRGPEEALGVIERSSLDLDDPAHHEALAAQLEQLVALERLEEAKTRIAAALKAHPDAPALHEIHGSVLRAAGAPRSEVDAAYERALALAPESATALVGLADSAAAAGEAAEALALYDRALAVDDAPETALAAARAELALGQSGAAVERLRGLLDRHPRESAAALLLARQLQEAGDAEGARDYARRAAWFREPGARALLETLEGPSATEEARKPASEAG